jgi:SAM-dependent methyltransferase
MLRLSWRKVEFSGRYLAARFEFHAKRSNVWGAIIEHLQPKIIGTAEPILDNGVGYGDFINYARASRKMAVDLVDVSSHMAPEVAFHVADATELCFLESNEVDVVISLNLFEHVRKHDLGKALAQAHRVLKPIGLLVALHPNFRLCYKRYFDYYTHRTISTEEPLCGILRAHGFEITCRRNRLLPLSMQSVLPKSYLLTKIYLKSPIPLMAKQMLVVGRKTTDVSQQHS